MKQKVGPAIISITVVLVLALIFLVYKLTFAPPPTPPGAQIPVTANQVQDHYNSSYGSAGNAGHIKGGGTPTGPGSGGTPTGMPTYGNR